MLYAAFVLNVLILADEVESLFDAARVRLWRVSEKMVNDFNGFQIKTSSDGRVDCESDDDAMWRIQDIHAALLLDVAASQARNSKFVLLRRL